MTLSAPPARSVGGSVHRQASVPGSAPPPTFRHGVPVAPIGHLLTVGALSRTRADVSFCTIRLHSNAMQIVFSECGLGGWVARRSDVRTGA